MAASFDEILLRMANSDPYPANGINGGQDVVGERLMSLLREMQLSPSAQFLKEDCDPHPDSSGMPSERDIPSATAVAFSSSGHIDYTRDRLLAISASSLPSAPPPGLHRKLNQYPAMRPKRATATEMEDVQQAEVRKYRKETKSVTKADVALDLPVLPNGLAFTYDPFLGVWIPRSRPEDVKGF